MRRHTILFPVLAASLVLGVSTSCRAPSSDVAVTDTIARLEARVTQLEKRVDSLEAPVLAARATTTARGANASAYVGWKDSAFIRAMTSDLRQLVVSEETYLSDSTRYATLAQLYGWNRFVPSQGVSPPTIVLGQGSWSATVTSPEAPGVMCGIAMHRANPVHPGTEDATPVCR